MGRVLTYAAALARRAQRRPGLQQCGVEPGVHVGFCLPNSSALIVGYYATWCAGGTVVPANPAARDSELTEQFADAGVALIVGAPGGPGQAAAERLGVPFVAWRRSGHGGSAPLAPEPVSRRKTWRSSCTPGGTTGVPKGAMLTHRNIVANTLQFARWYAFEPGDGGRACAIPMFHSGGMSGVMNVPLSAGATLLVFPRFQAAAVARAVDAYRVTRLFGVPTMFIALLNDAEGRRADYASLRACRTNAAPLPPTVKEAFDALVGREVLIEGYGLTETSPLTHANPIHRAKAGLDRHPAARHRRPHRRSGHRAGRRAWPGRRAADPRAAGDARVLAAAGGDGAGPARRLVAHG